MTLQSLEVKDPRDFPDAVSVTRRKRADALITFIGPFTIAYRPIIVEFATNKILKGNSLTCRVEQPTKFELVINLKPE